MPSLPRSLCKQFGCRNRSATGSSYCATHIKDLYKEQNLLYTKDPYYRSAHWKAIRERIIKRDPFCCNCLQSNVLTPSSVVDHIVPRKLGGKDTPDNLQGLCRTCHDVKRGRERWGK